MLPGTLYSCLHHSGLAPGGSPPGRLHPWSQGRDATCDARGVPCPEVLAARYAGSSRASPALLTSSLLRVPLALHLRDLLPAATSTCCLARLRCPSIRGPRIYSALGTLVTRPGEKCGLESGRCRPPRRGASRRWGNPVRYGPAKVASGRIWLQPEVRIGWTPIPSSPGDDPPWLCPGGYLPRSLGLQGG